VLVGGWGHTTVYLPGPATFEDVIFVAEAAPRAVTGSSLHEIAAFISTDARSTGLRFVRCTFDFRGTGTKLLLTPPAEGVVTFADCVAYNVPASLTLPPGVRNGGAKASVAWPWSMAQIAARQITGEAAYAHYRTAYASAPAPPPVETVTVPKAAYDALVASLSTAQAQAAAEKVRADAAEARVAAALALVRQVLAALGGG
jgi:hypothetical protein